MVNALAILSTLRFAVHILVKAMESEGNNVKEKVYK